MASQDIVREEILRESVGERLWLVQERVGVVNFKTSMVEWNRVEVFIEMEVDGLYPTLYDSRRILRRKVTRPNFLSGLIRDRASI